MSLAVAVLAAGLGTRMKSQNPKVLHPILGKPMVHYVIDTVQKLKPKRIAVVVNPAHKGVIEYLSHMDLEIAVQQQPRGTGDAIKSVFEKLDNFKGTILVVNGDTPLLKAETLRRLLSKHRKSKSDISVLSFSVDNPHSYGRIMRDSLGNALRIVEEPDLSGNQKDIREVNSGVYALDSRSKGLLEKIKRNDRKGEYYLTDILELGVKKGLRCTVVTIGKEEEFYGVNTMSDLLRTQKILQKRLIDRLMKRGVRFYDPDSVIVQPDVKIASDTIIYPCVCLEGSTTIGNSSILYGGVRIVDSRLGRNVTVLDHSLIEMSKVDDHSVVGPFAHLRPDSVLGKNVKIGNFVEIKNALISDGTKAAHLTYIGDASVGKNVNIGAGTITCNYDGFKKSKTVIEDEVFVGSDTQLIAPVTIGKKSFIAAGSTISENVSPHSLAISRAKQKEIAGWAKKKTKRRKK